MALYGVADLIVVYATNRLQSKAAEGASGALEGTPDGLVEVRPPPPRALCRLRPPQFGPEKVPDPGGQSTLLACRSVRFFCLIPQDTCLSRSTRPLICPANARARPYSQHDRLRRHIHRHGWRSRDVERRFQEPTSPRRYVLPAPLFSIEPPADAQPHPSTASRPVHSPTPSHHGCAARRCSCQMC